MKDIKEIKIHCIGHIYIKEQLKGRCIDDEIKWIEYNNDLICKLSKTEFKELLITGILKKTNNIGIYCWKQLTTKRLEYIKNDEILIKFRLKSKPIIINRRDETEEKIKSDYWDYDYDLNLINEFINTDEFECLDLIFETDEKLNYWDNLIAENF